MNTSERTRKQIAQFEPGQVFTYSEIPAYSKAPSATVKAFSRLIQEGEIKRLSKGHFYRPKRGIFGELKPSDSELLKSLLYKDGQLKGYVTGLALYNRLGLTTQVPRTVTVAVEGGRQTKDLGTLKARLIKSRAPIKTINVELLQYLDVLGNINEIPDTNVNKALKQMLKRIAKLDESDVKRIKRLAREYYSPKVTALTGYLLELAGRDTNRSLKKELNPLTKFKVGLDKNQWPDSNNWNLS